MNMTEVTGLLEIEEEKIDILGHLSKNKSRNRERRSAQEEALLTGKLGEFQELKGGGKRVKVVDVENAGKAICKWEKYSDIQCEVAAYIVSDIVGFDFVPATVIREVEGEQMSLQEFIPDTKLISEVNEEELRDDFYKLWIFDHIVRTNDREWWNVLSKNSRLVAIDHESAFYSPGSESDHDTYKQFYGEQCPEKVIEIFRNYFGDTSREERLRLDLQGLLAPEDIEETILRVNRIGKQILEHGQIPDVESMAR